MFGSGNAALSDVLEWSGDHSGCPRVVRRPFRMSGSGRRPFQMSGTGREALPDVWELLGSPPESPGVVGRPYRMSGSGRESLLDVREWSGVPPG